MGQLKRVLETIQAQFGRLTGTQKLLIGSLSVVMLMALFLVQQYTSEPAMAPLLPGAPAEEQASAAQFLKARGHPHRLTAGGEVEVPPGSQFMLLAEMTGSGTLPRDTSSVFDAMIESQSWQQNSTQTHQIEVVTVQKGLEQIMLRMPGVRSATVILDIPRNKHFGEPRQAASAVATVFADGGIDQKFADTLAHLVAGSRAGLSVERVRVIDGVSKRQYRATSEDDLAGTTYLEQSLAIEKQKRTQIYDMLAPYIPGVIVTVHVQVDTTRRMIQDRTVKGEGKGSASILTMERVDSREDVEADRGGEPGLRSNTSEDIATASSSTGSRSTESTSETAFAPEFGVENEQIVDPRGYPTKINAVVNIPRSYFVRIWQSQNAGAGGGGDPSGAAPVPTDADLQPVVDVETDRIVEEVKLQIDTSAAEGGQQGEVRVSMIPEVFDIGTGAAATGGGLLGTLVGGDVTISGMAKTVGLGLLALVSLGLMVLTASKASKRAEIPTAEELVGLPPTLDDDTGVVGEAGEAEDVMSAVELSDVDMAQKRMHEQVAELVQQNPEEAARLVGRWIRGAD